MDATNLQIMQGFHDYYLKKRGIVLDLGSYDVNGSFKEMFADHEYVGADIIAGPNVDIVLRQPYNWQFPYNLFDVIISASTIEHMEFPWEWFKELYRVLKIGGLTCIIAPAVIVEHRYPIDTFRYYPQGMRALAKWGGLKVIKVGKLQTPDGRQSYSWMVATK